MSLIGRRSLALLATTALVVSACSASTTPAPASVAPPASAAASSAAASAAPASAAPSPSPSAAVGPDLTNTNYKPEPVGKTGGKLVLGEWQEPVTIWWDESDNSATDVEAFGPSLWSLWNATADYKWYGQLASNVPTVANGGVVLNGTGMDVTINLRPGAMWSDGQPITCDDLDYQVKWQMDPTQVGNIQGQVGWQNISGVDGGTGTNCVAHFTNIPKGATTAVYEGYLGLWAPLLPKHYLQTVSVADAFTKLYTQAAPQNGVYSGPYMPTKWAAGAEIDYVPNPQFWSTIKKSTAPFDSVAFKYYSDATAEIAGFKNGETDVAMNYNHNDLATLTTQGIPAAEINAIDGTTYEQQSWNFADLTKKFGATAATALMTAIHYAYNKDDIVARITGGTVTATCNFNSPLVWYYKNIPCPAYDVAKANSILDAAGFTKGSDGIRVAPNGTKVELLGCTSKSRPYRGNTMTLVATQLKQIGVLLDTKQVPTTPDLFGGWTQQGSDVPCNTTHGNFDVAEFAWVSSIDPAGLYPLYYSTYDPSKGDHSGVNYIRVNNPALDAALNELVTTTDLTKIQAAMGTIQDIYVNPDNAFPEIPLYFWKTVELVGTTMHNVVNNATSATNTWNIEDWWRG
jgi:peptide/nickel transport system substrate-binding protein